MFVTRIIHHYLPEVVSGIVASPNPDPKNLSPSVRRSRFFLETLQAHWLGSVRFGESLKALRAEEAIWRRSDPPAAPRDYSFVVLRGLCLAAAEAELFPRLVFEAERIRAILEVTFGERTLALYRELDRAGFFEAGREVRPLGHPAETIRFLGIVERHTGGDEDLFDRLETLEFAWQEVKGINASLRTMAKYRERWGDEAHPKFMAFGHPIVHRAIILNAAADLFQEGRKSLDEIQAWVKSKGSGYTLEILLDRLEVEAHIIELYLSRPAWLERLMPDLSSEGMGPDRVRLLQRNEELKASILLFRGEIKK